MEVTRFVPVAPHRAVPWRHSQGAESWIDFHGPSHVGSMAPTSSKIVSEGRVEARPSKILNNILSLNYTGKCHCAMCNNSMLLMKKKKGFIGQKDSLFFLKVNSSYLGIQQLQAVV